MRLDKTTVMHRMKYAALLVPDEVYLRTYYRLRIGRRLNLDDPEAFTEKLQWLKINDRNPLYTTLVDKYDVKSWVAERIGREHVVPNLGIWESFDDIDFAALPNEFVLKCTHDSGGLSICHDKTDFDFVDAQRRIKRSLKRNYFHISREWAYRNVRPRVLAETYLHEPGNGDTLPEGLTDYKFFCFHGEPRLLYLSKGLQGEKPRRRYLNIDWTSAGFQSPDYSDFDTLPAPPSSYAAMLDIAKVLSQGIPFVRVDLYEHSGRPYFSEMTFHPRGGFMSIEPPDWDLQLGSWIDLSEAKRKAA